MPLRDAAAARIISDAINSSTTTIFDNEVGDIIDAAVAAAALIPTRSGGTYLAKFDLEAIIDGPRSPKEIVQPGANLNLEDVKKELILSGYRVSCQPKKSFSNAKDRVTFTIAWNV